MSNTDCEYESLNWVNISSQIEEKHLFQIKHYAVVEKIASTNDWAMAQFQEARVPSVCFAEQQTQGRGRNGRNWVSPKAQNIYMSLAWEFGIVAEDLHGLGLVMAVVIVQLLKQYGINAQLKWPNDVLVDGKKIAGILLESRIRAKKNINVVIGIGLNVDMQIVSAELIDQQWTDMQREADPQKNISRNRIAGLLLSKVLKACEDYELYGFSAYKDEWQRYDICKQAELEITTSDDVVYGKGLGISDNGALRVMLGGQERVFYAADVSIRVNQ